MNRFNAGAGAIVFICTVALSCGLLAPATCNVSPSSVVPSSTGVAFSVSASSASAQTYIFLVNAVGTDAAAIAHSTSLTFTALPNQTFDFAMSATPSSVAVARGKTALFSVAVDPNTGGCPASVCISCAGLPALTSGSFQSHASFVR